MVSIYSVYSFFINRIFLSPCPRFLCFGSHDPNEWFQAVVPLSHGILFFYSIVIVITSPLLFASCSLAYNFLKVTVLFKTFPTCVFCPTIKQPLECSAVFPICMRTPLYPGTSSSRGSLPPIYL